MRQMGARIDVSRDALGLLIPNSADRFKIVQKVYIQSLEVINEVVVEIWSTEFRRIRCDFR